MGSDEGILRVGMLLGGPVLPLSWSGLKGGVGPRTRGLSKTERLRYLKRILGDCGTDCR